MTAVDRFRTSTPDGPVLGDERGDSDVIAFGDCLRADREVRELLPLSGGQVLALRDAFRVGEGLDRSSSSKVRILNAVAFGNVRLRVFVSL